jgi:very-short-patch-repair endonuclease
MENKVIIPYSLKLILLTRNLRKHSTLAEVLLWKHLKGKKMLGFDFDRQKPIGKYIVDFYCGKLLLAIEIDGGSHWNKGEYDFLRQKDLEALGVHLLRFSDSKIKHEMRTVLHQIKNWIEFHK